MSVLNASKLRRDERNEFAAANLPVRGIVRLVVPELEQVSIGQSGHPGTMAVQVTHPYFGVQSWIRVMPETGTALLTQTRGDLPQPEIISYLNHTLARRLERGQNGELVFRRLNPGEIEVMSSGRAYTHWSSRGDILFLGGTTALKLSQSDLELSSTAVTHSRHMHLHAPATLSYEERYGYVKRADKTKPNALQAYVKLSDNSFAVEYSRFVTNKAGTTLVATQEGNVVDGAGALVKNSSTNRELRFLKEITDPNNNTLRLEVDDALNISIVNSATGSVDLKLSAGSQSATSLTGKTLSTDTTEQSTLAAGTTFTVKANQKASIAAPLVDIGNGGLVPVALGTPLINGVLTPILTTLLTLCNTMSADLSTIYPTTGAVASSTGAAISAVLGSLSNVASATVKVST
jgi:hypothetical protein